MVHFGMKSFQFTDVAGRSFTANLPPDSTAQFGCNFVAKQLSIGADRIRIVNRTGFR
jgi:hypothetical protein